ncbi:hypothetical protein D3C83_94460 [compost metagenome]
MPIVWKYAGDTPMENASAGSGAPTTRASCETNVGGRSLQSLTGNVLAIATDSAPGMNGSCSLS